MRRYDRLINRIGGISFLVLAPVVVLMVIYKHHFDPYLPVVFWIAITLLMSSRAYLQFAPKPKLSQDEKSKWLVKAASFYRRLGFFEQFADLTDDELATRLDSEYRKEAGESLDPAKPVAELELLELDKMRVWLSGLECDVCQGNDVYADIVMRLGEISRGHFSPTDIAETWQAEKGPIRVEFTHGGRRHRIEPKYRDDWIDTDFLFRVREIFPKTEQELVIRPGDPVCAVVLTQEERQRIRKERGAIF
ncbi:MAG: hypothetical protein JXA69_20400 [Phycisphaerae bacterium]|nr:hypothetical protein [Phycisphaerae bacterium]